MPGPIIKKPTVFRNAIPKPLQGLYDTLTDDPTGGLSPVPLSMVTGPVKGAKLGYRAAKDIYKPIIKQLQSIIQDIPPVDPDRVALSSRVTSYLVPHRARLNIPEFAKGKVEFPPEVLPYPSRPNTLVEKYVSQQPFKELERRLNNSKSRSGLDFQQASRARATAKAKLTEADVRAIKAEREAGSTISEIAKRYNVKDATIGAIVRRHSWAWVK